MQAHLCFSPQFLIIFMFHITLHWKIIVDHFVLQVLLLKEKLEDRDAEISRLKEELQQQQPQPQHMVDDEQKTELAPEKDAGAEGTIVRVTET